MEEKKEKQKEIKKEKSSKLNETQKEEVKEQKTEEKHDKAAEETEKEQNSIEKEIQQESVEKIEIAQKTQKKEKKKSFPWVLVVLGILLIIVAGFGIQKILNDQAVKQGQWDTEIIKTPVEIKNFYSSECGFCEKENSIIANFKSEERNIPVEVTLIDLAKEENKHYIAEFNLTSVPTALVNSKDLEQYPFVENLIKEEFTKKNGYYIIPESYLAISEKKPNIMLLNGLECDSGEGKVIVEQFCDYQTLGCALIFDKTKEAREKFAGEIIFNYKNYLVHGEKSETTAVVAECAREQGRFFGFDKYLYEKQFPEAFGLERDAVENSSPEVINGGIFVTQIPDANKFAQCIKEKEPMQKIQDENTLALSYGVHYTPSLVFDCKYIVQGNKNTAKISEIICLLHPELKGCKADETNNSN